MERDLVVSQHSSREFLFSKLKFYAIDTAENHETLPCGRPLGLAFTNENSLIVIHSYEGVYEINLDSGDKKLLISRDEVIGENVRKFIFNL